MIPRCTACRGILDSMEGDFSGECGNWSVDLGPLCGSCALDLDFDADLDEEDEP